MSGENNGRPHPGVRVLIADDHELMLDMLQALLTHQSGIKTTFLLYKTVTSAIAGG
jgi:hypothetical protein